MTQVRERAGSVPMSRETRGKALRERMVALGLDASKVARAVNKERNTINRAFEGGASELTYEHIEAFFDRYEADAGVGLTGEPVRKPVTIRMEEGGTIVVQGPLESDDDERRLANLGRELIREWRANRDAPDQ